MFIQIPVACPAAPTSLYTPVSVKGYQWLLIWALVKRRIAFIGNDQPGWRIWGIGLATGSHKPGNGLVWALPHHFPPPTPLDPVEILSSQRGARPEEGGNGGRLRTRRYTCWLAGSKWGGVGPLPCPGHDIVLLGLLHDRATHTAVLQGALPGQLPLLLCRGTREGSCVLTPGPPYLIAWNSLGWASIGKPFASLGTVVGILIPSPAVWWRQYSALHNPRQIVRDNGRRLTLSSRSCTPMWSSSKCILDARERIGAEMDAAEGWSSQAFLQMIPQEVERAGHSRKVGYKKCI